MLGQVEPIVVHAQVGRRWKAGDDLVEHSAKSLTVDLPTMNCESDDSSGKLVHHDHDRIGLHKNGFRSEKVHAPQAVL